METSIDLLFLIAVAFLFNHELDAIQQGEWRFFFALVPISDEAAYRIFTALHVPLLVFIMWNLQSSWLQVGLDIFLIVHAVLHWLLRNHPKIKFKTWYSRLWIFGGALIGLVHLSLLQE
jgi:Family of unknown function (DUF6713)